MSFTKPITHRSSVSQHVFALPAAADFIALKARTDRFAAHLRDIRDKLTFILSLHQSYATTQDEFSRIFECLESIHEVQHYLTRRTSKAAVFFPLNMTVYALVLYGVFPALVADHVFIRSPQKTANLMKQLLSIIDLPNHFPNIEVVFQGREEFVQQYVSSADITIFTGKLGNAQSVMGKTKRNSLFLFNGWGCNPIVVGEGADLDIAAAKTVAARLFSSGQDCAAPDTILVHSRNLDVFLDKLSSKLHTVRVGDYSDSEVVVGPLADSEQIQISASILAKSSHAIRHGGCIDFRRSIVYPSVIVRHLHDQMNFEELFAPLFFVNVYDCDADLVRYFEHPRYITNEMYVSLFGHSNYVEHLNRSIIVRDQVVFDLDRGNDEFGGYSMGASFVACGKNIIPKPVLVPRDIFEYLDPSSCGRRLTPAAQKKIGKQVRKIVSDSFGNNLIFGLVFGSVARGQATGASDINTMVVVREYDSTQSATYTRFLHSLHASVQLSYSETKSAIIVSLSDLDGLIHSLEVPDLPQLEGLVRNVALYTQALSGAQCGVSGDKQLSVQYGRRAAAAAASKHTVSFRSQINTQSFQPERAFGTTGIEQAIVHTIKTRPIDNLGAPETSGSDPTSTNSASSFETSLSGKVHCDAKFPSQKSSTSWWRRKCIKPWKRVMLRLCSI